MEPPRGSDGAACAFLVRCGDALALGHAAVGTALLLLHRFFASHVGSSVDAEIIAAACLLVVTKTCERPRMLRSVANVAHAHMNDTLEPLGAGSRYRNLKMCLLNAEQSVLRVLAFDVDVELPFPFLLAYARHYGFSRETAEYALRLASDCLLDPKVLSLPASSVAAASLRLASLVLDDTGKSAGDKWWYECDTSDDDVESVSCILNSIHTAENVKPPAKPIDP